MNRSYKLLVIDDSQEILAAIDKYLRQKKYEVATAADGLEGLKLLKSAEGGFDLVITDLVMPNVSGVGVIAILKKEFPGIPVVAITGYGEQPEALALEANADLVLEKPFDLEDLEQSIANLLSKQVATNS
jgi:two-component system cell cycle sensor histidine kinase/response regulator CckA